jgi:UTP--glucose-1-phosphate uridylyltransferase
MPDHNSVLELKNNRKHNQATGLDGFYKKLGTSTIIWVNQPDPKGFGDAVLRGQPFIQNEHFLVHAGDTYIISKKTKHLQSLMKISEQLNADAAFLVQEIEDPRQYGVIEGQEIKKGTFRVKEAVEKPEKPATNLAIMPIYIFHPIIFKALEQTAPGVGGEIQLTDAIRKLIEWKLNVYAIKLESDDIRLDIGSPETYWEALSISYNHFGQFHK